MKTIISIVIIMLIWLNSYSQVGGLSASKLGTLNTETVAINKIEFEPSFDFAFARKQFDSNSGLVSMFNSNDSMKIFSNSELRFTYGLIKNLEIGVSLPIDVSTISFGAKYKLPIEGKNTFGLIAGYNTLLDNNIFISRNSIYEMTPAFVGGLIMSSEFSDKFSIDVMAQYQRYFLLTAKNQKNGFFVSADAGYYLLENINFITGLYYSFFDSQNINNELFTISPGITIERAENFILVLNTPIDLLGKNEYKSAGFSFALTILLD